MNGVINVYKEAGMTSFQVVSRIRKITGCKKAGHTGTLDPDATGVLAVCLGKATKLVDFLMDTDKQYRARLRFGIKTDTQDISGTILEEASADEVSKKLEGIDLEELLNTKFKGEIMQIPPMYSALKVGGVKLVDAARKGQSIERKKRPVRIYAYKDVSLEKGADGAFANFTVDCSKGTYIRTLCEDIGNELGIPSCMESLVRSRTSMLDIESARTLDEIEKMFGEGRGEELIISTDNFLEKYAKAVLKENALKKVLNGNALDADDINICDGQDAYDKEIVRIYDGSGKFYALYRFDKNKNIYVCEKMFTDENDK